MSTKHTPEENTIQVTFRFRVDIERPPICDMVFKEIRYLGQAIQTKDDNPKYIKLRYSFTSLPELGLRPAQFAAYAKCDRLKEEKAELLEAIKLIENYDGNHKTEEQQIGDIKTIATQVLIRCAAIAKATGPAGESK